MLLTAALLAGTLSVSAQPAHGAKAKAHRASKKPPAAQVAEQAPPPQPMPNWPVNDSPKPASVVWDASGLRINASNSSLQQILAEVSTDTGTKVVGNVPDQRVFGTYGPGQASEVLLQLLQGSGYNVLLAGDLGHGAPSQLVLTPRRAGGASNNSAGAGPAPQQQMQPDADDEAPEQPDQPEEQPVPQPAQEPNSNQPNYGPTGPMRTPQEIMQEMQQRQLLQQQQMQQQMQQQQQQGNPAPPQQQENPE